MQALARVEFRSKFRLGRDATSRRPVARDDSESCRGRRDDDRERERRVIELRANPDDRAGHEESDGRRNGHDPNLPDDEREGADHCNKEYEAHYRTIGRGG